MAERDFLLWLFAHNVSVCDLGAAALLCKGTRSPRAAAVCGPREMARGAVAPPLGLWTPQRATACLPGTACCERHPRVHTCLVTK